MKEFSSYNSLGQSQFPQYYAPAPTYVPAGLPNNDGHGANVGVAGYPAIKTEGSASAGLPSTTGTTSTCHHLGLLAPIHYVCSHQDTVSSHVSASCMDPTTQCSNTYVHLLLVRE